MHAYHEALEIFDRLSEPGSIGRVWHQIGIVHQRVGDYDAAEDAYGKALQAEVEQCKGAYGHASEPWKTFGLLHMLEQAAGNEEAAIAARKRAVQAYLAYRRDGGESHSPTGKLGAAVHAALTQGEPEGVENLSAELARLRESPNFPDSARPFLHALQALLAGSRDPALAADPALDYDAAAELLLLLERLG